MLRSIYRICRLIRRFITPRNVPQVTLYLKKGQIVLNPQKSQVRLGRVLSFTASDEAVSSLRHLRF